MKKIEERFERIDVRDGAIFVDKETGIEYALLFAHSGCGLAMLMDRDGKPMIHKKDSNIVD